MGGYQTTSSLDFLDYVEGLSYTILHGGRAFTYTEKPKRQPKPRHIKIYEEAKKRHPEWVCKKLSVPLDD